MLMLMWRCQCQYFHMASRTLLQMVAITSKCDMFTLQNVTETKKWGKNTLLLKVTRITTCDSYYKVQHHRHFFVPRKLT